MKDDYYNKKNDQGKTDWSLLPWKAIESAARIMTIAIAPKDQGGKGYGLASWRDVPEGYYRYWGAMIRHIIRRFVYDEVIDQESGEPHMGHVICNAAFVFQKDLERQEDVEKGTGSYDRNFYCRKQKKEVEQLPHDRDFQTTYEDSIRQMELAFDYAKPESIKPKDLYCIRCGITYSRYLRSDEQGVEENCMHIWNED